MTDSVQLTPYHNYDHIYFSPHLDDVALSCGGRIANQTTARKRVLVVTIFTHPQSKATRTRGSFPPFLDINRRRKEDTKALKRLAADHIWLDYQDAIHRHSRYTSIIGLTTPIPRWETPLYTQVANSISKISRRWPLATLYFPLGIGNHIDHQLISAIGLCWGKQNTSRSHRIVFYEDSPYVCIPHFLRHRFQQIGVPTTLLPESGIWIRTLQAHAALLSSPLFTQHPNIFRKIVLFGYLGLRFGLTHLLSPIRTPLNLEPELVNIQNEFETKISAIGCYKSQITALFGNISELRRILTFYSPIREQHGERYWKKTIIKHRQIDSN